MRLPLRDTLGTRSGRVHELVDRILADVERRGAFPSELERDTAALELRTAIRLAVFAVSEHA